MSFVQVASSSGAMSYAYPRDFVRISKLVILLESQVHPRRTLRVWGKSRFR